MRGIDGISGASIVDIAARLVGKGAVVGELVDPFDRQGRPEFVALGGMIIDDVEDDLDTRVMECMHHLAESDVPVGPK
jgi:hypothetical protein